MSHCPLCRLWGTDHDFSLEEALHEIVFFRGESYYFLTECAGESPSPHCIRSNFSSYSKMVRSTCAETLRTCHWNARQFNCCDYFMPLQTELGICYALNSLQSEWVNHKHGSKCHYHSLYSCLATLGTLNWTWWWTNSLDQAVWRWKYSPSPMW